MGKNQRIRKIKREELKQLSRVQPKSWREKVKGAPFWVQFIYRFLVSSVIILPIALIGFWIVSAKKSNNLNMSNIATQATFTTDFGEIKFELFDKDAPKTVENFEK